MAVLFLSPHFPEWVERFAQALRERGLTVVGIADESYSNLSLGLRETLAEYWRVSSLHNTEEVVSAARILAERHGPLTLVESFQEFWIPLEAAVREACHVPGIQGSTVSLIREKARMRERFANARIPCAQGGLLATLAEAEDFLRSVGGAIIVKPNDGVGASNTTVVRDRATLREVWRGPAIVERFIEGELTTYDGLTDRSGRVLFESSLIISEPIERIVNERRPLFYLTRPTMPEDLRQLGRRILHAFGVYGRFFHLEFIRAADRSLTALEVNMRPVGGYTIEVWEHAFQTDIPRLWARAILGESVEPLGSPKCLAGYFGRRDYLPWFLDRGAVESRYPHLIRRHVRMPDAFRGAMGDEGWIVSGSSIEELSVAAGEILGGHGLRPEKIAGERGANG